MTKISYVKGSAVEPIGDSTMHIVHICNDLGYWGAGFVLDVSSKWAAPKREYKHWKTNAFAETPFVLGNIQSVQVESNIFVVNMLAQHGVFHNNPKKPPIRYHALEECLVKVAELHPKEVHMPRIGTGLARGNWPTILPIIEKTLIAANIPVFIYDKA